MANISRNLVAGSDLATQVHPTRYGQPEPYGPVLTAVVASEGGVPVARLLDAAGASALAVCTSAALSRVDLQALDPATVPYVNAFIRPHGRVEKYWRTGAYRLVHSAATITLTAAGTPAPVSTVSATPVVVGTISVPDPSTTQPPLVLETERHAQARRKAGTAPLPAGWTVIAGRSGDLVLPERTVQTFNAALLSRWDGHPAHPLAIGPAGTGKTESVLALAVAAGLEVAGVIQCGGIEGPGDLYGATTPDDTAPHGWRRFSSALWLALTTARDNPDRRYIVLLDEVNRMASLAAQNALLGVLDGTASLSNPATGEGIDLPANLFVVATANIGAAYSGTVRLDGALVSRWWTNLVFGYLPEPVEAGLFESLGLTKPDAKKLARLAAELRKADAVEPFRTALVPGTRDCVAVAHQSKHDPAGVEGAWHDKVTSSFSNEGRDSARTEYARARVVEVGIFSAAPVAAPTGEVR